METTLTFKNLSHLHIDYLENIDFDTLKQIGRTANQLSWLTISLRFGSCLHEMLNGLTLMFEGLKDSLKHVLLQVNDNNYDYLTDDVQALLRSLNENCPSFESLHIKAQTKNAEEFLRGFEQSDLKTYLILTKKKFILTINYAVKIINGAPVSNPN